MSTKVTLTKLRKEWQYDAVKIALDIFMADQGYPAVMVSSEYAGVEEGGQLDAREHTRRHYHDKIMRRLEKKYE